MIVGITINLLTKSHLMIVLFSILMLCDLGQWFNDALLSSLSYHVLDNVM